MAVEIDRRFFAASRTTGGERQQANLLPLEVGYGRFSPVARQHRRVAELLLLSSLFLLSFSSA
ncbi:MAG: hypothetical protein H7A04_03295 [Pseudomonadales bacterium]|nr:hypothetical protein [Pseudomonadales bacterium]